MITYKEFKEVESERKAFCVMGYKVVSAMIKNHKKYMLINTEKYGGFRVYSETDFSSFSKNLYYCEWEALQACIKLIKEKLLEPCENRKKELKTVANENLFNKYGLMEKRS